MKTNLKPILAAILSERGELRFKPKSGESTLVIDAHTLDEFDEISFDPDWVKTARDSGTAVYFSEASVAGQ